MREKEGGSVRKPDDDDVGESVCDSTLHHYILHRNLASYYIIIYSNLASYLSLTFQRCTALICLFACKASNM